MSTRRDLIDLPDGMGRVHDHLTGAGSRLRAEERATYAFATSGAGDDTVMVELERGLLWVMVPAGGAHPIVVQLGTFQLLTAAGTAVIEAGAGGDGLVIVAAGEVTLDDGAGGSRFLRRGEAAVLASDGTVTVDHVGDEELSADPWVRANTRLDEAPDAVGTDPGAPVGAVEGGAEIPGPTAPAREPGPGADPRTEPAPDPHEPGPTPDDEAVVDLASGGRSLDGRALGRSLQVSALVLLVLVGALLFVLSRDDRGGAGTTSRLDTATSRAQSSTTVPRVSTTTTTSTAPKAPAVRAQLERCDQRGGVLVATGTVRNARPPANLYAVEVTVRTPKGRVFGKDSDSVAVPKGGGAAKWRVDVVVEGNLSNTGAECEVTRVRALRR